MHVDVHDLHTIQIRSAHAGAVRSDTKRLLECFNIFLAQSWAKTPAEAMMSLALPPNSAGKNKDLLEVADALTDILYVTYGAGHAFGIDLDKCFDEVQNSNMSKLNVNGKPIYHESGKVMKGPNYFKPDLSKFVN